MTKSLSSPNPEMGKRARYRRTLLGITPIELCSILQVGTNRLGQMEREGCDSIAKARQWANALGLDPQDLVFGTPELDAAAGVTPAKKGQ